MPGMDTELKSTGSEVWREGIVAHGQKKEYIPPFNKAFNVHAHGD